MTSITRPGTRTIAIAAALLLWLGAAGAVAAGALADRTGRQSGPESSVAAYFDSVQAGNIDGALAQLEPSVRESYRSWVAWQMGNSYRVLESAVRAQSILSKLSGGADIDRATVVLVVEVSGKGNPAWRAVEEVPVVRQSGRWLLEKPPLEGR